MKDESHLPNTSTNISDESLEETPNQTKKPKKSEISEISSNMDESLENSTKSKKKQNVAIRNIDQ